MDMAAIAANPDHFPAPFEHKAFLNILHKAQISLFMRLFDVCHTFEQECKFIKAFFPCCFGEFRVHVAPFIMFARSCVSEIFQRVRDAAVERLEPKLCVLPFITGRFLKNSSELSVAFALGFRGILVILICSLRLPGKSRDQIGLCFRSSEFHCSVLPHDNFFKKLLTFSFECLILL